MDLDQKQPQQQSQQSQQPQQTQQPQQQPNLQTTTTNHPMNNVTPIATPGVPIDLEAERRKPLIANMEKIEREFQEKKELFFNEKIEELTAEYESINNGSHPLFQRHLKELAELKARKVWAAEKWKEYQLQNIENIFTSENRQAEEEYQSDIQSLKERMLSSAAEKKKKFIEEKNTMNLSDRMMTRTLRKKNVNREMRETAAIYKRRFNPPHINYTLRDGEIMDDLTAIQRAIDKLPGGGFRDRPKSDVYADKGRLYFHQQVFDKGNEVVVDGKGEGGRWKGTLVVINPTEIHVKAADGTRSRFSLNQLRNSKYNITLVDA